MKTVNYGLYELRFLFWIKYLDIERWDLLNANK